MNEDDLVASFLDALAVFPGVRGEHAPTGSPPGPTDRADAGSFRRIALTVGAASLVVRADVRQAVLPIDVHRALWAFAKAGIARTADTLPFLLAECIAPDARELLRDEGVGYYDRGGSLFLPAGDACLRVDNPPPRLAPRPPYAVFARNGARVLQVLLGRPRDGFRVNELAREARVSPSTASHVLAELERRQWLAPRGDAPGRERYLKDPTALRDAWVRHTGASAPSA